jgi:hypothetical protein
MQGLFVDKHGACKNGDVSMQWCRKCRGKKLIRTTLRSVALVSLVYQGIMSVDKASVSIYL